MKRFNRAWFIKLGKRLLYLVIVFWIIILILEGCFRFQLWDFYKTELTALNSDLDSNKPAILVMGDSFSADPSSWIQDLTEQFPTYKIINSAVPGTGIIQANMMAKRRFKRFSPKIFIYQVYVGNDLFDIRFPTASTKISKMRKFYWTFSNYLRVLNWMNYKSGQLFGDKTAPKSDFKSNMDFDPTLFSAREKLYFEAEPDIISNHIMLKGDREKDFEVLVKKLKNVLSYCKTGECEAYILVIPHCAQVSKAYLSRMAKVGAKIQDKNAVEEVDYPFLNGLTSSLYGAENVTVLSPLPDFQKMEHTGTALYFNNDIHLNPTGQRELGKWVSDTLQTLLRNH